MEVSSSGRTGSWGFGLRRGLGLPGSFKGTCQGSFKGMHNLRGSIRGWGFGLRVYRFKLGFWV